MQLQNHLDMSMMTESAPKQKKIVIEIRVRTVCIQVAEPTQISAVW